MIHTDDEEAFTLQEDLHKMYEWSKDWQMLFNAEKCKVLHLRRESRKYDYYLEGLISEKEEEKDLHGRFHQQEFQP